MVDYPLEQCLNLPPTDGQLEVVVNPDGSLARPARLLGSTGYDVLDEKALEETARYDFPSEEAMDEPTLKVYWLPVTVNYSVSTCGL